MTPTLESLRAAGVLSPLDEHFARAMGRIAAEPRPEVLLAAALVSRHVNHGHVCLDLPRLVDDGPLVDESGAPLADMTWPQPNAWIAALRTSPLVDAARGPTPLVLDSVGRLYLRRYWEHQERLAVALRTRAVETESGIDGAWLRDALDRLFPPALHAGPDWQRIAALMALQRRLCVISGGPGTGKTYTVVKILALLVEHLQRVHGRAPRVTLAAPTGKAAARLTQSIQRAKAQLDCTLPVRDAIPEEAATVHRCLGSLRGSSTSFRHHADNPLITDVVLVDEASMIDLALMSRLLAAVPLAARLILLGDADQLASVEAGAVLGDICNTGTRRGYSKRLVDEVEGLSGDHLPLDGAAPDASGIWDCIVQLTRSYRYGADSGIGALARAINAGDSAAVLAILESGEFADVALVEPGSDGTLSAPLCTALRGGFEAYLGATTPFEQLHRLESFRVLCAHRRGPGGVEPVNRQIEEILAGAGLIDVDGPNYVGRPIMVTRNDYQLNLFNGDVGLIIDDRDRAGVEVSSAGAGARAALFVGPQGEPRFLSPSRLPPYETVFAMSVHKSQGSEFDEVAVLLPPRVSPVVSRELLYTAVTRARRKVTIHATRDMVTYAVTHRIERASGLPEALWDQPGCAP